MGYAYVNSDPHKSELKAVVDRLMTSSKMAAFMSSYSLPDILITSVKSNGSLEDVSVFYNRDSYVLTDNDHFYVGPSSGSMGNSGDYTGAFDGVASIQADLFGVDSSGNPREIPFPSFSGTMKIGLDRAVFHEIVHAHLTGFYRAGDGPNINEEMAVFAENVIYNKIATDLGLPNGSSYRYGHDTTTTYTGVGVSGVNSFNRYDDVTLGGKVDPTETAPGDGKLSFVSSKAGYSISKTYHTAGYEVFGTKYDHYIELTETGPYVTVVQSTMGTAHVVIPDSRIAILAGDMIGYSASLHTRYIAPVGRLLDNGLISVPTVERVYGLGNDAFSDGGVRYAGVAAHGTLNNPGVIFFDASQYAEDTLVIGSTVSSGIKSGAGNDIVVMGNGSNVVNSGMGNDIIVGGRGSDHLHGEGDNDVFVLSGGAPDTIYGGDGVGDLIFLDAIASSVDDRNGIILRSDDQGVTISDTYYDIERFAGATSYIGAGNGRDFYSDDGIFYAAPGADHFHNKPGFGKADFSYVSTGLTFSYNGTSGGHTYSSLRDIVGTTGADIFEMDSAYVSVHGGLGNDKIKMGLATSYYGDGNDDTFVFEIAFILPSTTIDGGDGFDRLDLTPLYGNSDVFINLRDTSYISIQGRSIALSGIESVLLPGTTINTNLNLTLVLNTVNEYNGGSFNDNIVGGDMTDTIRAGSSYYNGSSTQSRNFLYGNGGTDYLYAGPGNSFSTLGDYLSGGNGMDYMYGNAKDDDFIDSSGVNYMYGGFGIDTMHLEAFRTSSLVFGVNAYGRYVTDRGNTFRNYFDSIERVSTYEGVINPNTRYPASSAFQQDIDHYSYDAYAVGDDHSVPYDVIAPITLTQEGFFLM